MSANLYVVCGEFIRMGQAIVARVPLGAFISSPNGHVLNGVRGMHVFKRDCTEHGLLYCQVEQRGHWFLQR
jgi:hypothetical protein